MKYAGTVKRASCNYSIDILNIISRVRKRNYINLFIVFKVLGKLYDEQKNILFTIHSRAIQPQIVNSTTTLLVRTALQTIMQCTANQYVLHKKDFYRTANKYVLHCKLVVLHYKLLCTALQTSMYCTTNYYVLHCKLVCTCLTLSRRISRKQRRMYTRSNSALKTK